jgi:hypothetical protein
MMKLAGRRFTMEEDRFSKRIKRHWADFITVGNPIAPWSFGCGLSWQRATPEDCYCMVLRSGQQLPPGQIQNCELDQGMASLWNELLPRLRQLSAADIKGDISIRNTDSRLGQDTSQPFRSAMYTLIGFVTVLLVMLVVCLVLLKRHAKERDRELF